MKPVPLWLIERAAETRGPEYLSECLRLARRDGDDLIFDARTYDDLRIRFPAGLGDRVAALAKPIARAIDAVAGTDLEHCGGCEKRQSKLNAAFPTKPNRA